MTPLMTVPTTPVQQVLERYLQARFPDVNAPIDRRWAGIMGFSVDGLPLVGTLPDKPRVGFAVGFTGHGLAMGAGSAERAVDLLLNWHDPRRSGRRTIALTFILV